MSAPSASTALLSFRHSPACSALAVAAGLLPPAAKHSLHPLPSQTHTQRWGSAEFKRRTRNGANFSDAQVRDLRSNDFPIYRNDRIDSSPRLSHATKYDGSHLGRSGRNYDDRYNDIRPPFRGKAPHQAPSPMMTPVRILRNPDRERERARESRDEFVEERGVCFARFLVHRLVQCANHYYKSRQFTARVESRAYSAAAPPSKARYLGDNIHSLTPTTSLSERCERYIDTLHPERPDPPTQDEPYEYPYTQPCEPTTLPEINGRNFPIAADWARPVYARTPSIEHEYFVPFSKIRPEKRSRHRHRRRDEFDGASSVDEDCARRMYRLHT